MWYVIYIIFKIENGCITFFDGCMCVFFLQKIVEFNLREKKNGTKLCWQKWNCGIWWMTSSIWKHVENANEPSKECFPNENYSRLMWIRHIYWPQHILCPKLSGGKWNKKKSCDPRMKYGFSHEWIITSNKLMVTHSIKWIKR